MKRQQPKPQRPRTNVEFVTELMEFGHPLKQIFVIQAIMKYADACAKADPKDIQTDFINGAAWVRIAQEIKAKCDEHYRPEPLD